MKTLYYIGLIVMLSACGEPEPELSYPIDQAWERVYIEQQQNIAALHKIIEKQAQLEPTQVLENTANNVDTISSTYATLQQTDKNKRILSSSNHIVVASKPRRLLFTDNKPAIHKGTGINLDTTDVYMTPAAGFDIILYNMLYRHQYGNWDNLRLDLRHLSNSDKMLEDNLRDALSTILKLKYIVIVNDIALIPPQLVGNTTFISGTILTQTRVIPVKAIRTFVSHTSDEGVSMTSDQVLGGTANTVLTLHTGEELARKVIMSTNSDELKVSKVGIHFDDELHRKAQSKLGVHFDDELHRKAQSEIKEDLLRSRKNNLLSLYR